MKEPTVTVSDDRMTAFVSGEVGKRVSQDAAHRLIMETLARSGVINGVDASAVLAAAQTLSRGSRLDPVIVARGTPGTPSHAEGPFFSVPVYRESDLPATLRARPGSIVMYRQLIAHIKTPHIVAVNDRVGSLRPAASACAGRTVYGEQVPAPLDSGEMRCDRLGTGLALSDDCREIIARTRGILVARGATCEVVPVNVNGTFTVTVAQDRMSAAVSLFAPGPGGRVPRIDEVISSVRGMKIIADPDQSRLRAALTSLSAGRDRVIADVRVAEGKPPRLGANAWIEPLVNLPALHPPAASRSGDHHLAHAFVAVGAGQNLARLHQPTPGEAGVDVYGSPVKVADGRPDVFRIGRNVARSKVDPLCVCAVSAGHVRIRNGKLEVVEVLHVKGDVDARTGMIEFPGDVVVAGDVRSGLSVRSGGSVWVMGSVEDAVIDARRDIVVKLGFVGQGSGVLRAGNDVVVAFVREQEIHAGNSIMVAGEVFNARLRAGAMILVEAKGSAVVGGEVLATRGARIWTLGNEAGRLTRIRVGVDPIAEARIRRIDADMVRCREALEAARAAEQESGWGDATGGGMAEDMMATPVGQPSAVEQAEQRVARLTELRKKIAAELYVEGSDVHVNSIVYPNVVVSVGRLPHLVREERRRCRFYGGCGRVQCTAL